MAIDERRQCPQIFLRQALRPLSHSKHLLDHQHIRRILTFNTDDSARYDIEAIRPLSLLS
jgi:hypothetical protein